MIKKLPERLNLPVDEALLRRIDEWRRQQRDIPARATAGRRLIEIALDAAGVADPGPANGDGADKR